MTKNKYIRAFYTFSNFVKRIFIFTLCLSTLIPVTQAAQTANLNQLSTWWHDNYELNANTPVADTNVRRSTTYDVKVYPVASSTKYDSYVYMTIPRGGREKWGYTHDDGAEFAKLANLTMSWSSFIYNADVWVEVSLRDGSTISSVNAVTLRPTTLNFTKELVDSKTVRFRVPYVAGGQKFSVEFDNQLYTAYSDMSGVSGKLTTQAAGNRAIHTEPRNALMIFAEAKLTASQQDLYVPKPTASIYFPPQGKVDNLNNITQEVVYFQPGTYYMDWNYHARLPANVKWVYFAPGAFVKGAIQFPNDNQINYKVTGFGVLSGEKYVYEADTNNYYQHRDDTKSDCHGSCVKMLQFQSSAQQQYLDLQGVTVAEPPYHSFVVYGFEDTFKMNVDSYKQIGAWYWQTDGLELYKYSGMVNSFLHSNDDVIKIYHSGVKVSNTLVWKNENGPVIQFGWTPRDIDTVSISNTNVIHNRMYWKDVKGNTCVINSSPHYLNMAATNLADPTKFIELVKITGLRVEGKTNCAIRWYALSSLEDILVKDFYIEAWNGLDMGSQLNKFTRFTSAAGEKVSVGNETTGGYGLSLENFKVGNEYVTRAANNWNSLSLGRLDFDGELWDNWNAWRSATQTCATQTINMATISDQTFGNTVNLSATASSGLPVSFTIQGGSASLSGSQLVVGNQEEQITLIATQSGNASNCPASIFKTFNVYNPMRNLSFWVAGSFNGWALSTMTYAAGQFEFTTTLSAGSYQLKFTNSNNWSSKDWGNTSGLTGYVTESTGGLPNLSFDVTTAGNYKIQFNPSTLFYRIELIQ